MPKIWAEVWTRPGDPAYGRRIPDLPVINGSATQKFGGTGEANLSLPENYDRAGEIILADPDTTANSVASTIRYFSETQVPPIFDWFPSIRSPASDAKDVDLEISGSGPETILNYARVEPWDWDGSDQFTSKFPDWIYGGRNLLGNPGMETSTCRPEVNQISFVLDTPPAPMSGSFFINDGVDSTGSLDTTTVTAFIIETELESGAFPGIDNVNVTGTGAEDDPFVIEFVVPCEYPGGLSVVEDPSDPWVDGIVEIDRTQIGALQPTPWTKSQVVSSGTPRIFGEYTSFRVTTAQAHTGTYSLLIDPAPIGRRYAGAQQVLRVKPGGLYQASVWVRTASAGQEYRLVIRGIDEDLMVDVNGDDAVTQVTLTANTWTQLSIPDVLIGNDTEIIFRIANINVSGNPAIFYVDDGSFNEGMASASVGKILRELYDHAVDPTLRASEICWDDGSATDTPYFTLDFSDTLDSAGAAWFEPSISTTIKRGLSYTGVASIVTQRGYEPRMVIDDWQTGTYKLQLYNPGTMDAAPDTQIEGGRDTTRSDVRMFLPAFSDLAVEAAGQQSARFRDAGLFTSLGRREAYRPDQDLGGLVDALQVATEGVAAQVASTLSLTYTLTPRDNGVDPEPLVSYVCGDTISVQDPPVVVKQDRRVASITLSFGPTVEYKVQLGTASFVGDLAFQETVRILSGEFKAIRATPPADVVTLLGGGGMITVVVAAVNASAMSQGKADFQCDGSNDHFEIMEAMEICYAAGGGTVWLSEGDFDCDTDKIIVGFSIGYPEPMTLRGMGSASTRLVMGSPTTFGVYRTGSCEIKDLTIIGPGGT